MLPVAPAGTGQPPSSPMLDSYDEQPACRAASTLARPCPRVLWKCAVSWTSSPSAARAASKCAWTCSGFAIPVVSPNATSCAPASARRAAMSSTRPRSTTPSNGQPKLVAMTASTRRSASRARAMTRRRLSSDDATERLTLRRLCVSDADRKTPTSSKCSRSCQRVVHAARVRHEHAARDAGRQVDRGEHLGGVRQLRDDVGAHEARDLDAPQPAAREALDQRDLVGGRDDLGLVLQPVARPHLADRSRSTGWPRYAPSARAITSCWISSVPSPIVRIFASRYMRQTGYSSM